MHYTKSMPRHKLWHHPEVTKKKNGMFRVSILVIPRVEAVIYALSDKTLPDVLDRHMHYSRQQIVGRTKNKDELARLLKTAKQRCATLNGEKYDG